MPSRVFIILSLFSTHLTLFNRVDSEVMPPHLFVSLLVRLGLFKGKTLVEELAFVRYFHYHPKNVLLHRIGFHFFFYALLSALEIPCSLLGARLWVPVLALVVAYSAGFMLLDLLAGLLGTAALTSVAAAVLLVYRVLPGFFLLAAVLAVVVGGSTQLFGHIYFDKSQPAFRAFEAFFTTPFYLYLSLLFQCCNYKPTLREAIRQKTQDWKGSERVVYGKRTFDE